MREQDELDGHASRAARALVLLHEERLQEFVGVWRRARDRGLTLPTVEDPDYASLDALLRHVIGAARFYVTWIAERLELPDPAIRAMPEVPMTDATLDGYLEHLLARWRTALVHAAPESMEANSWPAPWGAPFTADSMLEHAVMHPARHGFQLDEWMRTSTD